MNKIKSNFTERIKEFLNSDETNLVLVIDKENTINITKYLDKILSDEDILVINKVDTREWKEENVKLRYINYIIKEKNIYILIKDSVPDDFYIDEFIKENGAKWIFVRRYNKNTIKYVGGDFNE